MEYLGSFLRGGDSRRDHVLSERKESALICGFSPFSRILMKRSGIERTSAKSESSPYFRKRRKSPLKSSDKRSSYFVKSPVSCFGTVQKLGAFVCTLSDSDPTQLKCQGQGGIQICSECITFTNDGLSHFYMCDTFRSSYERNICTLQKKIGEQTLPCWKQADFAIQQSVRHLCPYRCYLRAFAPLREWLALRRHVHALTDFPLGTRTDAML